MSDFEATALRPAEIAGRGRALVAARPLRPGEVVLRESPLLLYSAFPFLSSASPSYCGHCFQSLASSAQKCSGCSLVFFCNPKCFSSHTPWLCESLRRLHSYSSAAFYDQPPERQVQARFLLAAYNLAAVSPSDFQVLLSLQGGGVGDPSSPADSSAAGFLHSLLSSVCPSLSVPISPEQTVALLAKDKTNAFGLMEPFSPSEEKRSVRAYGIYPKASFFNHDCLPNACRFDYVDSDSDGNTDIIIRMIHDVPEGREVCLSYFPVNLNYPSRQKRLLEDYGFTCDCDRCKVEATWSDNDEEEDEAMDEENDEEDEEQEMEGSDKKNEEASMNGGDESDFPHAYFFVRYMCSRENCGGTLAPLPSAPSMILECNVCGSLKEDEVGDNQ
ncbi:PREDICTED: histone-lysine N-methyltransferase ASHR2 [Tarenaya hassleriana]|uniref:histone-lysine N-methyltransferase ASHR2 n=1 Tax=Tarenaya hassleriana TaxID=28532 RepID=UPI00053C37B0|nr:PREDICTED: histone-lysine N-methyltransferase ASHR2 [Tarenaya hassleriana]